MLILRRSGVRRIVNISMTNKKNLSRATVASIFHIFFGLRSGKYLVELGMFADGLMFLYYIMQP